MMKHFWWMGMITLIFTGCGQEEVGKLIAQKGVFNIRGDQSNHKVYELDGDWFFTPGKHINSYKAYDQDSASLEDPEYFYESEYLNHDLNKATFYLQVIAPASLDHPALFIPPMNDNVDIYVNDKVVFCNDPVHHPYEEIDPVRSEIVSIPKSTDNIYHILLQCEPTVLSKNQIYDNIRFGNEKTIEDGYVSATLIKIFIAASYLILGIYLLTMFGMMPKEKGLLYFSLFSFFLTLRLMVTGDILINYLLDLNWDVLFRLEYISFYASALFMALFMYELFHKHIRIYFFESYIVVMVIFIMAVMLFPPQVFFKSAIPFQAFMIAISVHPLFQIFKIAIQGNYTARIFLSGFTIFYLTIINDILYLNHVIDSVQMFHYGNIFLIIAMSFLLPMFFTRSYNRAEKLNKKILVQNNELNKINTDLERFVYSVTHDLKAPLASLEGLVRIAKMENKESVDTTIFDKQEESINKLKSYIDEILTLSKNSQTELQIETIDVKSLLEDTISGFSYLKNSDNIEKTIEIHQDAEFESDLFRLKTVLRNLISNSIKYGDMSKAQPFLNIKVNISDINLGIEITDNGLGIAEDHQKKLFTMFFRAHDSKIEGTGLGLYIVKECLDLLQGTINITSIENIGTSVTISLPNAKNQLKKSHSQKNDDKNSVNRKIRAIGLKAHRKLMPSLKRA